MDVKCDTKDGGSKVAQDVSIVPQNYTVSQPGGLRLEYFDVVCVARGLIV
jgi:hypothetical protein